MCIFHNFQKEDKSSKNNTSSHEGGGYSTPSNTPPPFPPVRVNLDGIPDALRPYAQFFPWRWCLNDDGHPTKVPKWFERNRATGKFETYSIRANLPKNW